MVEPTALSLLCPSRPDGGRPPQNALGRWPGFSEGAPFPSAGATGSVASRDRLHLSALRCVCLPIWKMGAIKIMSYGDSEGLEEPA